MKLIKIVYVDVRGRGQSMKDAEAVVNEQLIKLQAEGFEIPNNAITLMSIDSGKMVYNILYNNPKMDDKKKE